MTILAPYKQIKSNQWLAINALIDLLIPCKTTALLSCYAKLNDW